MTEEIAESYVYQGLGFPIELHNVEMMNFYGEFHPIIDVRKVADLAIQALSTQENKFTGNQLNFIRIYLMINAGELAKQIHSSPQDFKKWEAFGDKAADMDAKVEKSLKQLLQNEILKPDKKDQTKSQKQLLALKGFFSALQKKPQTPSSDNSNKENEQPNIKKKPK
ncbi:MAG: hypothetical protein V4501_09980 [Pseudomonadota bacterium]